MICGSCGTPAKQQEFVAWTLPESGGHSAWDLPPEARQDNLTPDGSPLLTPQQAVGGMGRPMLYIGFVLVLFPLVRLGLILQKVSYLTSPQYAGWIASHPGFDAYLFMGIVADFLLIVIYLLLNYCFYRKKRDFMTLMVFQVAMQVVISIAFYAWARTFVEPTHAQTIAGGVGLVRRLLFAAIWAPCFLSEEKYKRTFIN
jgi:hypothetical protein